ncbi:MAG: DNA repair protein RadA [Rhodobacteraceae bacterium]|nr:DNA repair protein RadA [Paracoccaceae bacterium]
MGKNKMPYACTACGKQFPKWAGYCHGCESTDTIEEQAPPPGPTGLALGGAGGSVLAQTQLGSKETLPQRYTSGIKEFDHALGGGLVPASATLIGGDPGIGKSTLLLQAAAHFAQSELDVFYISGEEACAQIQMRAQRLGLAAAPVQLISSTSMRDILTTLAQKKPHLVIVDSIQTMWSDTISGAPGSINQVRATTQELTSFAKHHGTAVVLVGHVAKDGQIAGPRMIEHMVDTVLYFVGESNHQFRILRAVKNRYGPVHELGIFEMTGRGLTEMPNPSAFFLSERGTATSGSVVFAAIEGTRPVLTEFQALVAPTAYAQPRRTAIGWDSGRLAMVLAVLEARCQISFRGHEVYLNVAGGMKLSEPAADLAAAAALVSAQADMALPADTVVFGEISLSGTLRAVRQSEARLKEAQKLGFKLALVPEQGNIAQVPELRLRRAKNLAEFVDENFPGYRQKRFDKRAAMADTGAGGGRHPKSHGQAPPELARARQR